MQNKILYICILLISFSVSVVAQNENEPTLENEDLIIVKDSSSIKKIELDPLRPSRAAFYSAILPGLGQAYNKKYWKIPIVYAAIGTGVYFYTTNQRDYTKVRNAYKRRLAGFQDDEFQGRFTDDGLLEAQNTLRRNKELSLLVTIGLYALNIIDANVDAHLMQFNVNDDLTIKPHYQIEAFDNVGRVGLTLNLDLN